jgi:hypothetical protein
VAARHTRGARRKGAGHDLKEAPFEYSDTEAIDAQIVALKNSGADVFMNLVVGRLATRAIRKAYDIRLAPAAVHPQRIAIGRRFSEAGRSAKGRRNRHECPFQSVAQPAIQARPRGARVR